MAKKNIYSYLDQLSLQEILQLLTIGAKSHHGQFLEQIKIVLPKEEPFKYATLEIPDPLSNNIWESDNERQTFKALVEAYQQATGRRERHTSPGGDNKNLLEGISLLLLNGIPEVDEEIIQAKETQYLVVTQTLDAQEAENIFKQLLFHATSTRVSSSADSNGGSRYLYHIKNDTQRKSSFSSIVATDFFKEYHCKVLRGFESNDQVLFLPEGIQTSQQNIDQFCYFIENAPLLFGQKRDSANNKNRNHPIAALLQWMEKNTQNDDFHISRVEFLYLRDIRFFRQEFFTARKIHQAKFEYYPLHESQKALDGLANAIENAEPFIGYRLELKSTQYLKKNHLQQLMNQRARIDHQIAYHQSITKPQPILMRFSQKQLPALAAQIRHFPMHIIHDGKLKYGFQATKDEPAGYHFLLVDLRETARNQLDPLPLWKDLSIECAHTRFQLDPFWAYHYFDAGSESMVFVPEGTTLSPPIHDWERGNMDQFLRDTMAHWFKIPLKGQSLPAQPIYIFERKPTPGDGIQISILNQEQMQPLHSRLGWINDNLLLHQKLEREGLIKEMSNDLTWGEMAQKIKIESEKTRREFTETAIATSQHMSQTTNEMTRIISNEVNQIVQQTFRITQKIKNMSQRLNQWENLITEMGEIWKDIHQKKQETDFQLNKTKNEFWRMEKEIQHEIQISEKKRQELEDNIQQEILKIKTTTQHLKRRLKQIKL